MKKHFTMSLAVIFAVLGVYFVALKVLMKESLSLISHASGTVNEYSLTYHPRWPILYWADEAMRTCFSPMIRLEREVRGEDNWKWDGSGPEPDWVKEGVAKWPKP